MHWIYILQCENGGYYVGETTRLVTRFYEHFSGRGGTNTLLNPPESVVAIYPLHKIFKFINFIEDNKMYIFDNDVEDENIDNLHIENFITEVLMKNNEDIIQLIRGGKYTKLNTINQVPSDDFLDKLPICDCGLPCDIHKNHEEDFIYFRCPKKNFYPRLIEQFSVDDDACNFFERFEMYDEVKTKWEKHRDELKILFKKCDWLHCIPRFVENNSNDSSCVSCKKMWYSRIIHKGSSINLCFDCFKDKYDELEHRFKKEESEAQSKKLRTNYNGFL